MVEFHCAQCGSTLKKKQVEGHLSRGCFQVLCSDCGQLFEGMAYKRHCQCMTEAEKFYGSYLRKTEEKKRQKQWTGWKESVRKLASYDNNTILLKACEEFMKYCKPEEVKKYQKELQQAKPIEWKGWKATLCSIIKSENNEIKEDKLIEAAVVQFNLSFGRAEIPASQVKKTVKRKLQNKRYLLKNGRVRLRF